MRISKTIWITLGVAIFIIGFVVLYLMYSRQIDEQEQLKSKLETNVATLPKLVAERENWQNQLVKLQNELAQRQSALTEANQQLSQATAGWPKSAESIEYDEKLFEIADAWNLDITVVTAAAAEEEKIEGISFTVASFTVEVRGKLVTIADFAEAADYRKYLDDTVDDILAFIHTVASDKNFDSARIQLVDLAVSEPLTDEEFEAEGAQLGEPPWPWARITLTIYTYKGR
jgi:FtsZ-binding cell division protein ZapB